MKEVIILLEASDDYLLGRIHERATLEELEAIIRRRLRN
jgi:hypothetical protein